jgi:Crinkler effector protein N-terminal domain
VSHKFLTVAHVHRSFFASTSLPALFRLFMPTFNLNCWIFNEDYKSVFPIEIACTIAFQHVNPRNLDLWKVSVFIDTSLKPNVNRLGLQNEEPLLPGTKLSKVFSEEPEDEHIHIVVRPPTGTFEWLICYITS